MSSSKLTLPPYPVEIGSVKSCFPKKHLQNYIQCGNYAKVKKLLKKGIFPDSTNSQGQTPLFVAALLGLRKIVELLLNFGSNPNQNVLFACSRCLDWSTPVHAAAFSCDQWIISKLIDAGGDLRLHDQKSKQPYEWALMAGKDESAQMIDFINRCTIHMEALIHFCPFKPLKIDSNSASFIDLLSPRKANRSVSKPNKFENLSGKKVCNFGYGQFCVRDNGQAGFLLTFPFIEEKSLVREEKVPIVSYAAGPYMTMTNLLWGSTEVTVKGLNDTAHKCFADLLIAEEENMSYVQHPLILQLLALSKSPTLERKQLVFERVPFGSFYSIIHERRSEFPALDMKTIILILLQMIEALLFLHWRGFIHRSFSSHAIQILSVDTSRAKISNFEYMVERKDKMCDGIIIPIPAQLYRWSSPEVVAGKTGTIKSDIYSFCAVMQESLTDSLPWSGVDDNTVKDAMASGHYLTVDSNLSEPCYTIVTTGIQPRPQERITHLQDILYLLKNNYKHVLHKVPCTKQAPKVVEAERDCKGWDIPPDRLNEISDQFYTWKDITSYISSSDVSCIETQSGTLFDMVEQIDEMMAHPHLLEQKIQNRPGKFYQENVGSDCVTDTSLESEELDIDCSSLGTNELQTLKNRGDSIHIHNKSTLDNLLSIQTVLQEHHASSDAEEEHKLSKSVFVEENEFPVTVKVKHAHPLNMSKSYAKGPPLHYIPPEGAQCSRIDITSGTRRIRSESVEDETKKASKKEECCAGPGSLKGKTLEKLSTGQDSLQLTETSSKQSEADDNIMRHQYYPGPNSAQQGQTKKLERGRLLSSLLKSDSQHLQSKKQCEHVCDIDKEEQIKQEQRSNKDHCEDSRETKLEKLFRHFAGRRYQSNENEDDGEIPVGMKPLQDSTKDNDDSNESTETSYFTPETDVDKTEKETLNVCDVSDHSFGEWSPAPSSTACFDKTILAWTDERAVENNTPGHRVLEKNTPGHTAFGVSTNTRSTIDVEELSSISCDQKNSLLQLTTPRNTESSARHSTPLSPGNHMLDAISKRRFFQENQLKSPSTLYDKRISSHSSSCNVSTSKTSECFFSAMCESTDYVSPRKEKTLSVKDQNANITSIKTHKSGSDENLLARSQCSFNKTDLQCQSMEITCLVKETMCGHSESGMFQFQDNISEAKLHVLKKGIQVIKVLHGLIHIFSHTSVDALISLLVYST
ncbi:inactive serine/threonine-protein kinase TEX14 isoform X4 [Hyla sarda]|uniref:inactive serine/threonine-protein kinase TEX14 isoform X4 n=1 Tax=Hyla sarda TaxID=327740 RepID=UPI0024C44DAE|nr:inactive serine/threonine-protein kinase TEX14 isoform X4 [Hyla sarda]